MKKPVSALLALVFLAAAPVVHAQDGTAYYGVSIGEIDYSDSESVLGATFSDSVSSWRLMVGYQFMEHLGVEGSYGESSTVHDTATFLLGGESLDLGFDTGYDKILTIRLLGTLPFDNGFSLMAGLGYADFDQEASLSVNGELVATADFSDNRPTYFFGAQYDFERIALRLGYEKFDLDGDVDSEEISLTFFYKI